jgi:hypothetical protein
MAHQWTDNDDALVKQNYLAGISAMETAAMLGITGPSVRGRISRFREAGELPATPDGQLWMQPTANSDKGNSNPQQNFSQPPPDMNHEVDKMESAVLRRQLDEANHRLNQIADEEEGRLESKSLSKSVNVVSEDPKAGKVSVESQWKDDYDPDKAWASAEKRGRKAIRKAVNNGVFDVSFEKGPIAISVISDQHIAPGSTCDFERLREDAELIRDTPGFYAVFGGDGVDNHIKHRSALIHAQSSPDQQWKLFDHYLQLFGDKILTIISGNHDAWTAQIGGVDFLGEIAKQNKICYAPAEARLNISVAGQEYKMMVRHQSGRFNSSLNQTHAVKRHYEYGTDLFDIGVICHHHEAACEAFIRHGLKRYAARPGSYQILSPYAHQYGYSRAIPTCPTFILFPKERRMIGFDDVKDAVWAWGNLEL